MTTEAVDGAPLPQLRQGDVCTLDEVPIWNLKKSSSLRGAADGYVQMPTWDRVARHGEQCLAIVCSQCCDLENPRGRTGVLIAPLQNLPDRHVNFAEIKASARPNDVGSWSFMNLFPIEIPAVDGLVVADLSALTTMAPAADAVQFLQGRRLWSMPADTRNEFRVKLGLMVGRDPSGADRPPG